MFCAKAIDSQKVREVVQGIVEKSEGQVRQRWKQARIANTFDLPFLDLLTFSVEPFI